MEKPKKLDRKKYLKPYQIKTLANYKRSFDALKELYIRSGNEGNKTRRIVESFFKNLEETLGEFESENKQDINQSKIVNQNLLLPTEQDALAIFLRLGQFRNNCSTYWESLLKMTFFLTLLGFGTQEISDLLKENKKFFNHNNFFESSEFIALEKKNRLLYLTDFTLQIRELMREHLDILFSNKWNSKKQYPSAKLIRENLNREIDLILKEFYPEIQGFTAQEFRMLGLMSIKKCLPELEFESQYLINKHYRRVISLAEKRFIQNPNKIEMCGLK